MLSRSVVARYALVAVVSAFVAIATAATAVTAVTAVTAHNDGFNERIVNCFDSRDPNSDQCRAALEVSPVDANFFGTLADNLDTMPAKEEPKPEVDLYALVKDCAATQNLESDECVVALEKMDSRSTSSRRVRRDARHREAREERPDDREDEGVPRAQGVTQRQVP